MRFLFVDRIVHSVPGEWVAGIKQVTRDDAYVTKDGQGRLCFIPSLIGETLGQLAAWNVMHHTDFTLRPVAGVVASAKLFRPAYLGETLLLESYIDSLDEHAVHYHSIARVGEEPVFSIEGALGPLLPMTDFIDVESVKQQFREIHHPGDWSAQCALSVPLDGEELIGYGPTIAPMLFDKILSYTPGEGLVAEKRISLAAPYFADHFPQKPVLPMTVLLECKMNLARVLMSRSGFAKDYQVVEMRKIKMNEFVLPGDVVLCSVKIKQHTEEALILSYRSEVNGKRVCVMELLLEPKGR